MIFSNPSDSCSKQISVHKIFKSDLNPLFPVVQVLCLGLTHRIQHAPLLCQHARLFHNVQHQLSKKGQLMLSLAQSHASLHLTRPRSAQLGQGLWKWLLGSSGGFIICGNMRLEAYVGHRPFKWHMILWCCLVIAGIASIKRLKLSRKSSLFTDTIFNIFRPSSTNCWLAVDFVPKFPVEKSSQTDIFLKGSNRYPTALLSKINSSGLTHWDRVKEPKTWTNHRMFHPWFHPLFHRWILHWNW